MIKLKKSGPALFMYGVIAFALAISITCFVLHYGGIVRSGVLLWTGITFFTILYHFWLRSLFDAQFIVIRRYNRPPYCETVGKEKR